MPNWAKDGGPAILKENLRSEEKRKRMKEDMLSGPRAMNMEEMWLTAFRKPDNAKYDGHSLAEIGRMRGQDPLDTLFDLLLAEDLGISFVAVGTNPQTLPDFVANPYGMVASDAILFGEWPSPRTYGCFPVVLAEFVRAEKQLMLPEAIRKMTSFPCTETGTEGARYIEGRRKGRRCHIRPQDGESAGNPRQSQAVSLGYSLRDCQRPGGGGQQPSHRSYAGNRAEAREILSAC